MEADNPFSPITSDDDDALNSGELIAKLQAENIFLKSYVSILFC